MDSIMVKGKLRYFMDNYDFADILREEISDEASDYFLDACNPDVFLDGMSDSELMAYCSGECEKVQETQRHYSDILRDVMEELEKMIEDEQEKANKKPGLTYSKPVQERINKYQSLVHKIYIEL